MSQCPSGKRRWITRKAARKAAKTWVSGTGLAPSDRKVGAYHCELCGYFHLGHTPKSREAARARTRKTFSIKAAPR
jgi:hypothetical protein